MEWSEATIENDGFSMVLGQPTIGNDGFSMVGHHWSNDEMVTYHRRSLILLLQGPATHPLEGLCAIKIIGPYHSILVDATGPETISKWTDGSPKI